MSVSEPTARSAGLEIRGFRPITGPNVWRLDRVAVADLEITAEGGLRGSHAEKHSTGDQRGVQHIAGEVARRMARFTSIEAITAAQNWPELAARLTLALQRAAGSTFDEFSSWTAAGSLPLDERARDEHAPPWTIAVSYEEEELVGRAFRETARILRDVLRGDVHDLTPDIERLRSVYRQYALGPTMRVLVDEAKRRGIIVRRVEGEHLVQLGLGKNLRRIDGAMTDGTSVIAVDITSNKERTKRALARLGLGVPEGGVAVRYEDAVAIADDIGYPVLVKPLSGNNGRGISSSIGSEAELRSAFDRAAAEHREVVVEKFVAGRDHRVTVVNGKVVAVAERIPAHVVGDGRRSIRELVAEENKHPWRGNGPNDPLAPIELDQITTDLLARSGRTTESVPAAGGRVFLRSTANISTGGTPIDRTDEIHPDNVAACEMAAAVIGLDIAGLDILTEDISVPFRNNGAAIIEVNASPGLRMHTHPIEGTPRNVPGAILDMLYPHGAESRIPIIAITGTNGKTTTTRLIAHLFRQTGKTVGYTTTDGVYLQNRLLIQGDMTGPFSANIVLSNPRVEVAVLETARGGVVRSGLGFDESDVSVVLNVTADHLGLRGINTVAELAQVKGIVARVVRPDGYAVLNADDPLVVHMAVETKGSVVWFSVREERNEMLEAHVASGGIAAGVQDGSFVVRKGKLCIPIAPVKDVPLTIGGAALFAYENVLAAIAAAYVQGVACETIRDGLLSFSPSPSLTPGRMNLLRTEKGRVLIDYGHNPAAVLAIAEFVSRLPANKRIGVISVPGDRRDDDLREVGRACGRFDYVIVKEVELYRRGRPVGQTAALITEGAVQAGVSPENVETILEEEAAVVRALEVMQKDDLLVIFADDHERVLEELAPLAVPA